MNTKEGELLGRIYRILLTQDISGAEARAIAEAEIEQEERAADAYVRLMEVVRNMEAAK